MKSQLNRHALTRIAGAALGLSCTTGMMPDLAAAQTPSPSTATIVAAPLATTEISTMNPIAERALRAATSLDFNTPLFYGPSFVDANAGVHTAVLTEITNDRNQEVNDLSFIIDAGGTVQGVMFSTTHPENNPPTPTYQSFSIHDIESGDGVVLATQQGHNLFYLKGNLDSTAGTGTVDLRYLANGLWGTYQDCPARVGRTSDGLWHLYNATTGAEVKNAQIETWSMGITTIHGICTTHVTNVPSDVSQEQ